MTLEIVRLAYHLHKRPLIEEISLSMQPGFLYGILGPNGSGKSTLLKTICRIWAPTAGQLYWQGHHLLQFSRLEMSRTLSLVPQQPPLHFDFTAAQMVAMGRYPHGTLSSEARCQVEKALVQVDAWPLRHRLISQLSGGERQRIYIARALATQAPILLLDEPTSYLDLRHQLEIWHLLRALASEGKLVIAVVHDLLAAQRFCDRIVILNKGRCQAIGSYDAAMSPQLLQEIFGVKYSEQRKSFEAV